MKIDCALVRRLRLERSWSQETLAGNAGLNLRTVQRLEASGTASLRTRRCIAAALDVEPAALDVAGLDAVDRDAANAASAPAETPRSGAGAFVVGVYALSAVLHFGFVVLDQVYARLVLGNGLSGEEAATFSGVADFLLQFAALTTLLALGAIALAWQQEKARWLLIASVASGVLLPLIIVVALNLVAPGGFASFESQVAGPLLRLAIFALSAGLAVWGWIAYARTATRPALRESADRDRSARSRAGP